MRPSELSALEAGALAPAQSSRMSDYIGNQDDDFDEIQIMRPLNSTISDRSSEISATAAKVAEQRTRGTNGNVASNR